jgi:hypothetical protein
MSNSTRFSTPGHNKLVFDEVIIIQARNSFIVFSALISVMVMKVDASSAN